MDEEIQLHKSPFNSKPIFIRGIITSIIVGSILLSMNHYEKLFQGIFNFSWLTNYIVPFLVSVTAGILNNKDKLKVINSLEEEVYNLSVRIKELSDEYKIKLEKFIQQQEHNSFTGELESSFNDLVWNYKNDKDFGEKLLSFICRKFGLAKGLLYLTHTNDLGNQLEITLNIASKYASKKEQATRYEPGEGLIGQCYIDKKIIVLEDVPEDFLKISSGLGEMFPKNVLIVPLVFNEKVTGVIELASFNSIHKKQIESIERLATQCAAVFHSLNEETTIKDLLDESSKKTELLKKREEELQIKLEEITTFHKELSTSEAHLKKQIDENKQQQLNSKLNQANTFVKAFLKESKSEINFLSNTPPISGMRRAMNPERFDEQGNSSFEQWVTRMTSIIKSLLVSKHIFSHFVFYIKETQEIILQASRDKKKESINLEILKELSGTLCVDKHEFSDSLTSSKDFQAIFIKETSLGIELTGQLFLVADLDDIQHFIKSLNNEEGYFMVTNRNTDILTGKNIDSLSDLNVLVECETRLSYQPIGSLQIT